MRAPFSAIAAIALSLVACGGGGGESSDADAVTGDDDEIVSEAKVELFMTSPIDDLVARGEIKASDLGPLATTKIADGSEPDKRLVKLIDSAKGKKCSVLLADYDFNLQNIADAMVRAKKRGCDVRMVTDGETTDRANPDPDPAKRYGTHGFHPEYEKPLAAIIAAGIPVHDDGARGNIMHNKFVVINGRTVFTGSWNMSNGDLAYWNHALVLNSPELAARYTTNFEFLFKQFAPAFTPGQHVTKTAAALPTDHVISVGGRRVEVFFPRADKATARLTELLSQAKQSIHFMAFQFTTGTMSAAVLERAQHGIEVRGVFENNGACGGAYPAFLASQKMTVARWGLGHLDGLRNFLHHKVFIIDKSIVVIGSFNFSASADTANDENLLIVTDPAMAEDFEEEYKLLEAVTAKTKTPPPCVAAPAPPPARP